jgi:hypothetical protein
MEERPPAIEGGCEDAGRSPGQPTRCGPPNWGLGVGHQQKKKKSGYENYKKPSAFWSVIWGMSG